MSCPTCGAATRPGQRFCMDCGTALNPAGTAPVELGEASLPTSVMHVTPPRRPVAPPATNSPQVTLVTATATPPPPAGAARTDWGSINIIEQTPTSAFDHDHDDDLLTPAARPGGTATITWRPVSDAWPTQTAGPWLTDGVPNRIPLAVVSGVAVVLGIVASIVTVGSYELPGRATTRVTVRDLASNAPLAMILAAVVVVIGVVLAFAGQRLGAGLAGGAAGAVAGLTALDAAAVVARLHGARDAAVGGPVTITWEPGFFVVLAAGAFALIALFVSFPAGADDGRSRLQPALCAIGALGAVAVAVGPAIPGRGRQWSDNVDPALAPTAFAWLRIAALALVALTGVIGFATMRHWGAGLAVGGLAVVVVQWVGTLATPVDRSRAGVGIVSLSSTDGRPNLLVTVGILVTLAAAVAAVLVAAITRRRAQVARAYVRPR